MTAAYIAGFIDGEGSIGLTSHGRLRRDGRARGLTFRPVVTVYNKHRGVLESMRGYAKVGRLHVRVRNRQEWSDAHIWKVDGGRDVEQLLRLIAPHLVVKREQATLLLRFIERRREQHTRPYTETDYELVLALRKVNGRHPGHGSPMRDLPGIQTHKVLGVD